MYNIDHLIYQLRKDFGKQVQVHTNLISAFDPDTGQQTVDQTTVNLSAVVLPQTSLRKFEYDLTYLAPQKNFLYGARFQIGDCVVIVKHPIEQKDWLTFDSRRYNIERIAEYGQYRFLHVRRLQGEKGYEVFTAAIEHVVSVSQEVANVP